MNIDTKNLLQSILSNLSHIDYIKPQDLPNIDLYMDQVTTFMEQYLSSTKRHKEDKILTKTMINNYAKNDLLPPPVKKKYTKEHILMLVFIYYFKNLLSINDIQTVLHPISEKYFGKNNTLNLEDIYSEILTLEKEQIKGISEDISRKFQISQKTFEDLPEKEQEEMQRFAFLCMLSFDVSVKKLLIEKLIDSSSPVSGKDKRNHKTKIQK